MSNKMTNCKVCGEEIAVSAKTCPKCGAKNKKPVFKKVWFWFTVIVLLFVIIGSCDGSDTTSDTSSDIEQTETVEQNEQVEETEDVEEPAMTEEEYKAMCIEVPFENLARDPDSYYLTPIVIYGQIIQVLDGGDGSVELRVNTSNDGYGWYDDTIYVAYEYKEGELRLLEEDLVTIYGASGGLLTYESAIGAAITLPSVYAQYIDLG